MSIEDSIVTEYTYLHIILLFPSITFYFMLSCWYNHKACLLPYWLYTLCNLEIVGSSLKKCCLIFKLFSINEIHHLFSLRLHTHTNSCLVKNMVSTTMVEYNNIQWWHYANERHNITLCNTSDVLFNIMCFINGLYINTFHWQLLASFAFESYLLVVFKISHCSLVMCPYLGIRELIDTSLQPWLRSTL